MAAPPAVFTLAEARASGLSKDRVYEMARAGDVDRIGRGVFVRPDAVDPAWAALAGATSVQPTATLCLTSALVHHGLSDALPFATDIALPRGVHPPAGFDFVTWHSFAAATFTVGRDEVDVVPGMTLGVYSAERTIIDCFRLMHREGNDVAYTALRRWVATRGHTPSSLLRMARDHFPRTRPRLHQALETLL